VSGSAALLAAAGAMASQQKTIEEPKMKVVDPHIHLWDTARVSYPWLASPGVAYSGDNRRLPQQHDVQAFLKTAAGIEVLKTVNVEANPADTVAEAQWLQTLADDRVNGGHPHGIIAYVDLSKSDAPRLLEALTPCRNLRGVRQILNTHHDPRFRYLNHNYLADTEWCTNLRRLAQYTLSFDLQIYPHQVSAALQVIDANAGILFILNHAGMFVDRNSVQGYKDWRDGLRRLASRENTAIKLSGFAMFDHYWTVESFRPYILEAIDTFGARRCMFASNFPIDGLHASYADLWSAYSEITSGASETERAALFRDNAVHFYRL
jgi:predicted TIM-barrel fold metal-dependent hydrolase